MGIHEKLKALKKPISTWSRVNFADLENKISKLEKAINELQINGEVRELPTL